MILYCQNQNKSVWLVSTLQTCLLFVHLNDLLDSLFACSNKTFDKTSKLLKLYATRGSHQQILSRKPKSIIYNGNIPNYCTPRTLMFET